MASDSGATIHCDKVVASKIGFPASQSASADANTLDDYEEGTFSPAADDYDGTMTFTTAYYTKIGRIVNFSFKMTGDNTSDSSQTSISGFPFAVLHEHPASLSYSTGSGTNGAEIPNAMVNTAEILYVYIPDGGALTYTLFGSGYIRVAGTYMTE